MSKEPLVESAAHREPQAEGASTAIMEKKPSYSISLFGGEGFNRTPFAMADDFAAWLFDDNEVGPGETSPATFVVDPIAGHSLEEFSNEDSSIRQSFPSSHRPVSPFPPPNAWAASTPIGAGNATQRGDIFLRSGSGQVFAADPKRPSRLPESGNFPPPTRTGSTSDNAVPDGPWGIRNAKRPYKQYQEDVKSGEPGRSSGRAKPSIKATSSDSDSGDIGLSIGRSATQFPVPIFVTAGDHLELEDMVLASENLPYKHVRMLGHGGTASVEMVRDMNTGSVYARKIVRNVYSRNMKEARRQLHNEVQILRRLAAHHHIVKVHATYIAKRELAIVLHPVADSGDLASFLQDCRDGLFQSPRELEVRKLQILHQSIGCLAMGLAFIHQQTIRHKDIKPQNILIHRNQVLYTDFGLSYDFGDAGQSTTTGPVQGLTRRYCAPEVAAGGMRNSKSDMFSLGCVYLEIIDGLYPGSVNEAVLDGPFHERLKDLSDTTDTLWMASIPLLRSTVFAALLRPESSERPSALEVSRELLRYETMSGMILELFCARCDATLRSSEPALQQDPARNALAKDSASEDFLW
jgi:serine/threonine protein kinase